MADFTPPPGAPLRSFTIHWRAVIATLPNHFALFVLAADSAGKLGQEREILGALRMGSTSLAVNRGAASSMIAFGNAMLLGADHILEGYDHLLFLLALLLPAPLIAVAGRWRDRRSLRSTAGLLARIVTAFTIGHSLTLIGATVFHLHLPTAPVEVAIAVSVFVSALHAIRPLLPGREPLVASVFGLVHGLAFATLLADAGASATSSAVSLLGFNLGIEVAQLSVVVITVPWLYILLHDPDFAGLRVVLAGFTLAASLLWIVNRTTRLAAGAVVRIEGIMAHAIWGIAMLALLAAFSVARRCAARPAVAALR